MFAFLSPAVSNSLNIGTAYTRNFKQPSQTITFIAYVHYYSPDKKMANFFHYLAQITESKFLIKHLCIYFPL
jgi:hypothetical protein